MPTMPHPFIRPPIWHCETCDHEAASFDRVMPCPACGSAYVVQKNRSKETAYLHDAERGRD